MILLIIINKNNMFIKLNQFPLSVIESRQQNVMRKKVMEREKLLKSRGSIVDSAGGYGSNIEK